MRLARLAVISAFISFLALLLHHSGKSFAQSAPKATFTETRKHIAHQVVRITEKGAGNPCEVAIAMNPTNISQLIAVSHTVRDCLVSKSSDGGKTWKNEQFANPSGRRQGDDVVFYDPKGTLYHVCLRFQGLRQRRPQKASSGIFVSRWLDYPVFSSPGPIPAGAQGKTEGRWSDGVPIIDHFNTVEPMEDKAWLAFDDMPDSKYRGNIYASWTRFDVYGSKEPDRKTNIYFSRSTDGAKSFSPCQKISDTPGDCLDGSNTVMGAIPCVGLKGEVYVVWSGPEGIVADQSKDGGLTFGEDTLVTKTPGGWDITVDGIQRSNGLPVIGIDTSSGPHRGNLYVTWIDKRNNDPDVFCSSSRDGKTWSEPVRVNDDEKGNGKDQIFHWMAVDPADGSINVIFYDRRGLDGTKLGLTFVRSIDGGKTFVNYTVDQEPFDCYRDVFFGDYIGLAAHQGHIAAVYSHFVGRRELALSAALFHFKPGTQEVEGEATK
jgi:hypothetical protein